MASGRLSEVATQGAELVVLYGPQATLPSAKQAQALFARRQAINHADLDRRFRPEPSSVRWPRRSGRRDPRELS